MKPINIKETYSGFLGIDNINDHTQIIKRPTTSFGNRGMPQVRLLQANNIDIHNDYHLSRCDGYSLVLSGVYTNVWSNNDICLAVNSKNLVQIHPDFSTTLLLANIGSNDIDYETVNDWVYFTNSTIIGKIKNGSITLLPSTNKEFKSVLPSGNIIRYFQGSIYVVNGNVIYISDVINKDIFDRRWGFYQIGTDITMFESVNDGFYVSDLEKVYFMKRTGSLEEVAAIPKFDLIERHGDWRYAIDPDALNIIDWVGLGDNFWEIRQVMEGIQDTLRGGVAVIVLQKTEGKALGEGGTFSEQRASIYLNIDSGVLTVRKIKETKHNRYFDGLSYGFDIVDSGAGLSNIREVKKCSACSGTGEKYEKGEGKIQCPDCKGTGWKNKPKENTYKKWTE